MRSYTLLLATVAFLLSLGAAPQGQVPPPPGVNGKVAFKIPAGPLLRALDAIEQQAGVAFSVLPELLPPDLKAPATTHEGSLAAGLDRLLKPLKLRWEIGEFGGIVVLPTTLKLPSHDDWVASKFQDAGLEVLVVGETGTRQGLQKGDIIVAVNGELVSSVHDLRLALKKSVPIGATATFTLRRGSEQVQIKAEKVDDRIPLGIREFDDSPSFGKLFEKAGHRNGDWDDLFKKAFDEYRQDAMSEDPEKLLAAVKDAAARGCRDPLLPAMLVRKPSDFTETTWEILQGTMDPERLRSTYGGTRILTRAEAAAAFARQGPHAVRERARRFVECAWGALRPFPPSPLRNEMAYTLAVLRFLEGDYSGCVRLMDQVRHFYVSSEVSSRLQLHIQALYRLRRYDEGLRALRSYSEGYNEAWSRTTTNLLTQTKDRLTAKPELVNDRLPGPVGLIAWKPYAAAQAIAYRARGMEPPERRPLMDQGRSNLYYYRFNPVPFHERAEIHFFPRLIKEYVPGGSKVGLLFGAVENKGGGTEKYEKLQGAQLNLLATLKLGRFHKG